MDQYRKPFDQLVSEKAGCNEFSWNGYIRIYEEGEKKCECKDCMELQENMQWDKENSERYPLPDPDKWYNYIKYNIDKFIELIEFGNK